MNDLESLIFNTYFKKIGSQKALEGLCNMTLKLAQKNVEYKDKMNFIYDVEDGDGFQLIVGTTKTKKKLDVISMRVNHNSDSVWGFEIVDKVGLMEDAYLVNSTSTKATYCVRLINNCLLGEVKRGDKIDAKVCGMVLRANLFSDEEEFKKSLPEVEENTQILAANGAIMPIFYFNNHAEKGGKINPNNRKSEDAIITFKGILKNISQLKPNLNGNYDFNTYFKAEVETRLGTLPIIFNGLCFPEDTKQFKEGDIIVAEAIISADVCVNKYDKYKHNNDFDKLVEEFKKNNEE